MNNDDLRISFGNMIKEARINKGMSAYRLSKLCDKSNTYISFIEQGKCSLPSEDTIRSICQHLDLNFFKTMCLANKIPQHIINKLLQNPHLLDYIENYKEESQKEITKNMNEDKQETKQTASAFRIFRIVMKEELGILLKESRVGRGISLKRLSALSKMSMYQIKKLEDGKTDIITSSELNYLCQVLAINPMYALELTNCSPALIEKLMEN